MSNMKETPVVWLRLFPLQYTQSRNSLTNMARDSSLGDSGSCKIENQYKLSNNQNKNPEVEVQLCDESKHDFT